MSSFQTMKLPAALQKALATMQFQTPTPIQVQAIPIVLAQRDLIGCAQTGTGKTAAFSIPLVARLLTLTNKSALVLAPTRELAVQITEVLKQLTADHTELKPVLLIGGVPMGAQIQALRKKPRILVATPGRLLDHVNRNTASLDSVALLVLDEADRMLDMGFLPQLNEILSFLPKNRQTLLFSATLPDNILKLASKFLKDPARVTIGAISKPIEKIKQSVIHTTAAQKNEVLLDELNAREGSVLIFARTQRRTDQVAKYLITYGHSVVRIHGGRTQTQRNNALTAFREGEFRILVATDIAARGLDVPHIAHVINYDLPQSPEDYVHRIGRTARAGAEGEALCLLLPEDARSWQIISGKEKGKLQNHSPKKAPNKTQQKSGTGRKQAAFQTPSKAGNKSGKTKAGATKHGNTKAGMPTEEAIDKSQREFI